MEFTSKESINKAFSYLFGNYIEAEDSTKESPKYVNEKGEELLFKNQGYVGVAKWFRENYSDVEEIMAVLDEGSKNISNKEKNEQITAALTNGVQNTISSGENFKEWLKCSSKFPNYSFNNSLLIYMQNPEATQVCGYKQWQNDFERHVKAGEKGLTIFAPIIKKKTYKTPEMDATGHLIQNSDGTTKMKEVEEKYTTFRAIYVFDVSQTEGKELPTICKELQGNVEDYQNIVRALEIISPARVEYVDPTKLAGAKGSFYHKENIIKVCTGMSELQTIKTLVHEIAHAKLGHGSEDCMLSRNEKELQAESVAFMVCANLNIDTSDYSFEYLSSWSNNEPTKVMDLLGDIQATAANVIKGISSKIEELSRSSEYESIWEDRENKSLYAVYQLPIDHEFTFMSYETMASEGYLPNIGDYELKYVGEDNMDLEEIYEKLNSPERPNGQNMRSLSVSDVVVKHSDNQDKVYMVDSFGFKEIENFEQTRSRAACL